MKSINASIDLATHDPSVKLNHYSPSLQGGRLVRVAYSRCNNNVAEVQEKIKSVTFLIMQINLNNVKKCRFKVPELGAIHTLLEEILETQRAFRLKEEARMKHREVG